MTVFLRVALPFSKALALSVCIFFVGYEIEGDIFCSSWSFSAQTMSSAGALTQERKVTAHDLRLHRPISDAKPGAV